MRKAGDKITLTFKNRHAPETIDGTEEIEFSVGDWDKTKLFLERLGLIAYREQEKIRHTFQLGKVTIDIDTWPGIPTWLEIEASHVRPGGLSISSPPLLKSKSAIKTAAKALGFDWEKAVFLDARRIIEDIYHVPVGKMKVFRF